MTAEQGLDVVNAFRLAKHRGMPLSGSMTVAFRGSRYWEPGRSSPQKVAKGQEWIRQRISRFYREDLGIPNGGYIYSVENPEQGGRGPHAHYALHLPGGDWALFHGEERAERKALLKRNLAALQEAIRADGQWVGRGSGSFDPVLVGYCRAGSGHGWVGYMLKGLNPDIPVVWHDQRTTLGNIPADSGDVGRLFRRDVGT